MGTLQEHEADCRSRFGGNPFTEVHKFMDAGHEKCGGRHRLWRHHREGIEEARVKFGDLGAMAAMAHVLLDCGRVPKKEDYTNGKVDWLGLGDDAYKIVDKRTGLVVPAEAET